MTQTGPSDWGQPPPIDYPPPKPKRPLYQRAWFIATMTILAAMLIFGACVGGVVMMATSTTTTVTPTTAAFAQESDPVDPPADEPVATEAPVTAQDELLAGMFTEGQYEVGSEIEPGTYRTSGSDTCYWARLKDFEGGLDSVLANDLFDGPGRVTIRRTDKGIEFTGGCVWARVTS